MRVNNHDFFVRILSNKPTEKRLRNEEFLAVAFAELLKVNPQILLKFLNKYLQISLADNYEELIVSNRSDQFRSIYDILITDNKSIYIILELKVDASIDNGQLRKYVRDLEDCQFEHKGLCLITKRSHEFLENNRITFRSVKWSEIEDLVKEVVISGDLGKYIVSNYLCLAEKLNLNNRASFWTCNRCGMKTSGYGVYRHQQFGKCRGSVISDKERHEFSRL